MIKGKSKKLVALIGAAAMVLGVAGTYIGYTLANTPDWTATKNNAYGTVEVGQTIQFSVPGEKASATVESESGLYIATGVSGQSGNILVQGLKAGIGSIGIGTTAGYLVNTSYQVIDKSLAESYTYKFRQRTGVYLKSTSDAQKTKKVEDILTTTPADALTKEASDTQWKSTNEEIVKVDAQGNLTAVGKGGAVVSADFTDMYGNRNCLHYIVAVDTNFNDAVIGPDADGNYWKPLQPDGVYEHVDENGNHKTEPDYIYDTDGTPSIDDQPVIKGEDDNFYIEDPTNIFTPIDENGPNKDEAVWGGADKKPGSKDDKPATEDGNGNWWVEEPDNIFTPVKPDGTLDDENPIYGGDDKSPGTADDKDAVKGSDGNYYVEDPVNIFTPVKDGTLDPDNTIWGGDDKKPGTKDDKDAVKGDDGNYYVEDPENIFTPVKPDGTLDTENPLFGGDDKKPGTSDDKQPVVKDEDGGYWLEDKVIDPANGTANVWVPVKKGELVPDNSKWGGDDKKPGTKDDKDTAKESDGTYYVPLGENVYAPVDKSTGELGTLVAAGKDEDPVTNPVTPVFDNTDKDGHFYTGPFEDENGDPFYIGDKQDGGGDKLINTEDPKNIDPTDTKYFMQEDGTLSPERPVHTIPTTNIRLNTEDIVINAGQSVQLTADRAPENSTDAIMWLSGDEATATVDSNGRVTGMKAGTTKVFVVSGAQKATATVKVMQPAQDMTISNGNVSIIIGESMDLKELVTLAPADCTDTLEFTLNSTADADALLLNGSVATGLSVKDNMLVKIQAKDKDGNVTQTGFVVVSVKTGEIPTTSILLTTGDMSMKVGETQQAVFSREPADSTDAVIWSIADPSIAAVDGNGNVTGVKAGETTITVTSGAQSATAKVTVSNKDIPATGITVEPASVTVAPGSFVQLTPKLAPADSNSKVSWSSVNPSVATVDATGKVTGITPGNVNVIAVVTNPDGSTYTALVPVVVKPQYTGITIDGENPVTKAPGATYTPNGITGQPGNAVIPMTDVTWSSSNPNVAAVDSNGTVTARNDGTTTITATYTNPDGTTVTNSYEFVVNKYEAYEPTDDEWIVLTTTMVDGKSYAMLTTKYLQGAALYGSVNGIYANSGVRTAMNTWSAAHITNKKLTASEWAGGGTGTIIGVPVPSNYIETSLRCDNSAGVSVPKPAGGDEGAFALSYPEMIRYLGGRDVDWPSNRYARAGFKNNEKPSDFYTSVYASYRNTEAAAKDTPGDVLAYSYWLRSQARATNYPTAVFAFGGLDWEWEIGMTTGKIGLRPAIWVEIIN